MTLNHASLFSDFDTFLFAENTAYLFSGNNIVGSYINQASAQQVRAINDLGQKIGYGLGIISDQLSEVNDGVREIYYQMDELNRNTVIQIEQQKITNLLLNDIGNLLRVPDSEKQRQHHIEMGLKFFVNAQHDEDLFDDALKELLNAEQLMKQDYFVLHRIGLVYMHSQKNINPQKALDYFTKAAKYASIESDPNAARLANILATFGNHVNTQITSNTTTIQSLVADSYEQAAFTAYVLGNFELAVELQTKALKYEDRPEYKFYLAKYQARIKQIDKCIQNLNNSIDENPKLYIETFKDLDLLNEPDVLKLLDKKNNDLTQEIQKLIKELEMLKSDLADKLISRIKELENHIYDKKRETLNTIKQYKENIIIYLNNKS